MAVRIALLILVLGFLPALSQPQPVPVPTADPALPKVRVIATGGLMLATLARAPWHLYLTLGVLVGGGSVCLGYTGQALFLPNWFVRRRGLALSVAFSGVGVGSIVLLPWLQSLIARAGWRSACWAMAIVMVVLLVPLNLLLRRRPEDLGLEPDGDRAGRDAVTGRHFSNVVDSAWVAVDWTLARALRTGSRRKGGPRCC